MFVHPTHWLSSGVDGGDVWVRVMAHLRYLGMRSLVPAMACVEVVLHFDHRMVPTVRNACHVGGSRRKRSVHLISGICSFDLFGPVRCWVDGIALVISVGHFQRSGNSRKRGGEGWWGIDSRQMCKSIPQQLQEYSRPECQLMTMVKEQVRHI